MLIDYASCMCGVKAVLYHCSKDSFDEGSVSEHPCSCGPPEKILYGEMGMFSGLLCPPALSPMLFTSEGMLRSLCLL